jgi:hypothetical protein
MELEFSEITLRENFISTLSTVWIQNIYDVSEAPRYVVVKVNVHALWGPLQGQYIPFLLPEDEDEQHRKVLHSSSFYLDNEQVPKKIPP